MKYYLQQLFLFFFVFVLSSCGNDRFIQSDYTPSPPATNDTFSIDEKLFVHYTLFKREYLWYEYVPDTIDYDRINTRSALIESLKYQTLDRWSFVLSLRQYNDFANQTSAGFGISYNENFTVVRVLIDSPAWQKILRGDRILSINNKPVSSQTLQEASLSLGESAVFRILRSGKEMLVTITPQTYSYKSVLAKILTYRTKRIGYLRLDTFSENSAIEIEQAFDLFASENIDDLIIDLRYNGGGFIATASILLDNITGQFPDDVQVHLTSNDLQNKQETYNFESIDEQDGNELKLKRVAFLVSRSSASASELVIGALKPYLGEQNVITIGDYTHGKPVGMTGKTYDGRYIYFLINFIVENALNEHTPFEGIKPTCFANDDITRPMGDPQEEMLQSALTYITEGSCPAIGFSSAIQKPAGFNPAFMNLKIK